MRFQALAVAVVAGCLGTAVGELCPRTDAHPRSLDCKTECADFKKAIGVCNGQGIMGDYDCTCKPEIFSALAKCGKCMPETYAPYGGLKAFVQNALEDCKTNNNQITFDASKLPGETEVTDPLSEETVTALAACTDKCLSVCNADQIKDHDTNCVCTNAFITSQLDCTGCAIAVTNDTSLEKLVLKEAQALVGECSAAKITGLTVPKSIKAIMPIVNLSSGEGDGAPAAKDGPGPSGGTGSGDDETKVTYAPKPKSTAPTAGSALVGAAGRSSTIASGGILVIAALVGVSVL